MNEPVFANYENYYCATSHQVTEVIPLTQSTSIEFEDMPATIHYINGGSCDMAPISQVAPVDQRHQQQNLYTFTSHIREQQDKLESTSASKRVTSANSNGQQVTATTAFGSIPFVQIHTTDVQPQRTSYGNVFRRNVSRQEEIKSEPIKSENNEAAKERLTTPTPPRANSQATQNVDNFESMEEMVSSNDKQADNNVTTNIEEKSLPNLQIYKCSECAFISLKETERDNHIAEQHGENNANKAKERIQLNCPGCSNVFFMEESLKIHLKLDHLMSVDDVNKLILSFVSSYHQEYNNQTKANVDTDGSMPIHNHEETPKEPLRKSRIYLKNVECLREPNRQPMEQTENQLEENNTHHNIEPKKSNASKQKISIKSVDVLREPALLRRDYEMQNSNFLNFNTDLLNSSMDLLNTPINLNSNSTSFDYSPHIDSGLNNNNLNNNNESSLTNSKSAPCPESNDKARKPKIYVKSVESFNNLMPLDTLHNNNNNGFPNDHSNLCNNNQVYDTNVVHLQYLFDSNTTANNLNSNANFINNHNDMDTFQLINTSTNQNNNYILDNTMFLNNNDELNVNVNGEQMENVNFMPDSTTPTPPITADINLGINKPLTSSNQEQRGTLHLRTVDELNLMNKTEVQHLIAPNLDNNHGNIEVVDKINSSSLNDINLIGDELYEDENFKFHDLDTQMVNDWPETYDDLAEDINCIIADASNENSTENINYNAGENNHKLVSSNNFDIDTPQVSLITIRDIEELTGTINHTIVHTTADQPTDLINEQIQDIRNELTSRVNIVSQETLMPLEIVKDSDNSSSNLKRELANATPETNDTTTPTTTEVMEQNYSQDCNTKNAAVVEVPPLVPVTHNGSETTEMNLNNTKIDNLSNTDTPVPPLVPVSPLLKINTTQHQPPATKPTSPVEKGRIYVANNLMEPSKRPVAVSATSGTSVRGRPFGSNRTRITKLKQTIGSSAEDLFAKCALKGCAFRFKKTETVEYHRKCHDMSSDNPQAMLCPECKSKEFNNWNTLHTHLWRAHKIDMELYKCELCEFKTPIFSRLVNTHAKIHFDDRNYKCEQCDKAFKNSKQLKNHRRWHRVQATTVATSPPNAIAAKATTTEIHRCLDCGSTFSQHKTLREHCCKKGETSLKCSICEKLMSSKSSLKLHLLTHSDGEKRYKCQNCDYATNDHNAFRRHRMGHENRKMYECHFCPYKSVQSVAYQKHILQKHPDKADSVIHKCTSCSYSTINRSLLIVHQAKHDNIASTKTTKTKLVESDSITVKNSDKSVTSNVTELQKSKIKVKSNLFTTNIENDLNMNKNIENAVQLYTVDSGSIT